LTLRTADDLVDVAFAAAEMILCDNLALSHDFIQTASSVAQAFRALQRKEKGAFSLLPICEPINCCIHKWTGAGDTCWKFPSE